MIHLGDYNTLRIVRFTDHGAYLDGGEAGEILMPKHYVERAMRPDDTVDVFVYFDQSERLVATRERALARVGDFAYLTVSWVNAYGAFLDWGLMKDLFVPFREQKREMEQGRGYIVYIYIDPESGRIVGSAKVERFLKAATPDTHHRGQDVQLLVQQKTDLGFKVIVDNAYSGLVYDDQIFEPIHTGDLLTGTVVTVRPDGKLDVALGRIGTARFRDFADQLLEELKRERSLPFTDHSSAESIAEHFGVSKKTFKRAVGTLYKARKIRIEPDRISLNEQ